ncbi:MAG: hypothetical protein U0529_10770 [Thermoanaerobaculia bacterium]
MTDSELLAAFVAAFERHDDMLVSDPLLDPAAHSLRIGNPGPRGVRWRVKPVHLTHRALERFYSHVPGRLPRLYEQLITSYRWADVDIGACTLLGNPPAEGLSGLTASILRDRILTDTLFPNGLIPFARASGGRYDPVCFATRRPQHGTDVPVVRVDHEQVRRFRRVHIVAEVAPSFRALVQSTIETGA